MDRLQVERVLDEQRIPFDHMSDGVRLHLHGRGLQQDTARRLLDAGLVVTTVSRSGDTVELREQKSGGLFSGMM